MSKHNYISQCKGSLKIFCVIPVRFCALSWFFAFFCISFGQFGEISSTNSKSQIIIIINNINSLWNFLFHRINCCPVLKNNMKGLSYPNCDLCYQGTVGSYRHIVWDCLNCHRWKWGCEWLPSTFKCCTLNCLRECFPCHRFLYSY